MRSRIEGGPERARGRIIVGVFGRHCVSVSPSSLVNPNIEISMNAQRESFGTDSFSPLFEDEGTL
jgi:hypothetical protein